MEEQGEQSTYNIEHLLGLTGLMAVQLSVPASRGQQEDPSLNLFLWFSWISRVQGKDGIWHLRSKGA